MGKSRLKFGGTLRRIPSETVKIKTFTKSYIQTISVPKARVTSLDLRPKIMTLNALYRDNQTHNK
jgi:hypothetical protein